MKMGRFVLLALVGACLAPESPTPVPPPPPPAPLVPLPPPVERLALFEHVEPADLLAMPREEIGPFEPAAAAPMPDATKADYEAVRPKSIVELQPWRQSKTLADGVVLTDLHPRHHRVLLLQANSKTWHLENRRPDELLVDLDASDATGLAVVHLGDEEVYRCTPWTGSPSELDAATATGKPYAPICDEHLLVRNTVAGRRSTLEWATEFVRGNVVGGEHLTTLVKQTTQDRHRKVAAIETGETGVAADTGPLPVRLEPASAGATIGRKDLGLPIDAPAKVPAGAWHPVTGHPGVYTSLLAPRLVEVPTDPVNRERAGSLDAAEGGALAILLAFDLSAFDLEFEVGTEHPGVEWSARAAPAMVNRELPGPDGIGTIAPIGRAAQVAPLEALRLEATFIGGFKREHSAFKDGDLSTVNGASHYGVVQDGVVHSKLRPGLATLVVYARGEVDIRTWSEADDAELDRVLHARQNGVPILQQVDGAGVVTPHISSWRQGNWSGSATGDTRTIRAGACIQESERGRFLVYGYFTAATPKAMARTFLAAGCRDAIHLDMNALEHTYAAVYERSEAGAWTVHHLDTGMAILDKSRKGLLLPRFVAFADNRDFFMVLRK